MTNPDGTFKFNPRRPPLRLWLSAKSTHGGGYIVSHEKALRHKVWDVLEEGVD